MVWVIYLFQETFAEKSGLSVNEWEIRQPDHLTQVVHTRQGCTYRRYLSKHRGSV